MTAPVYDLPVHKCLSEPELLFHPERDEDRHQHPLVGLSQYGPFSRSLVNCILDPIRIAIVAPSSDSKKVDQLVMELEQRHKPRERSQYLLQFPGFSNVFGIRAVSGSSDIRLELPGDLEQRLTKTNKPHVLLAEELTRALDVLQAHRSKFDVLLVYLPIRWEHSFYGAPNEDFDLHDYLKAVSAVRAIPVQIVREDRAFSYFCRCSVMWRLGLALYCKAGGVPWKLANVESEVAYIGISYSVRKQSVSEGLFVTCCSQVFDADGAGLEFLLYETDDIQMQSKNPFLSRTAMRRVMARSLALYQRRHAGRIPKRVVIHKSTEFKPEEVDGCFDAWQSAEGLDLIHIQQNVSWRGVKIVPPRHGNNIKGVASPYPCERGTYLQIGQRDALLWTQGNAPSAVGGVNYYKEGKGIPSPLLLRRFAGHGTWDDSCRSILGLTKMNWNNDLLYDRLPVTLGYASVLARTVKRMPHLGRKPYQLRFFM
ncbi:MAG: argonaute/piwi family protein [Planctomycetota bacterium]|jgi:hypothetical protein